jgi:hypothetical protein
MHATQRSNLLLPACGLSFLTCAVDLHWGAEVIVSAGYVFAVMVSLRSNRVQHVAVTCLVSICLLLTTSWQAPPGIHTILDHATISVIVAVLGTFGSINIRRARQESIEWALGVQARREGDQLRVALARAEAAETKHREAHNRLTITTQSAGISTWEWDLHTNMLSTAVRSASDSAVAHRCRCLSTSRCT